MWIQDNSGTEIHLKLYEKKINLWLKKKKKLGDFEQNICFSNGWRMNSFEGILAKGFNQRIFSQILASAADS